MIAVLIHAIILLLLLGLVWYVFKLVVEALHLAPIVFQIISVLLALIWIVWVLGRLGLMPDLTVK